MRVRSNLLFLPIHRHSAQEYYGEHDAKTQSLKQQVEEEWQAPFAELPPHVRILWQDSWYWPPWFFNDLVGFLRIASDETEDQVAGRLFLVRSSFPETAPERFSRGEEDLHEIVLFERISGRQVDPGNNESWVEAIESIIEEAQKTIHRQAQGLEEASIWLPDYDLSCFDFARAARQLRERAEAIRSS